MKIYWIFNKKLETKKDLEDKMIKSAKMLMLTSSLVNCTLIDPMWTVIIESTKKEVEKII